jgi:hypothetical protein
MKNIVIAGAVLIVILAALYFYSQPKADVQPNTSPDVNPQIEQEPMAEDTTPTENEGQPQGKLKADTFSGTLEAVDTGCFADGECFIVVDGKHVTAVWGWGAGGVSGTIQGVNSFGDLEAHIGEEVEVYAQDNSDGTYTIYGSEGFYIKVI